MTTKEDENEIRREITLHSFRCFVKTTISDLGYSDYSVWFIGHYGSTYWRKKDNEKAEIFQKIEPYLTFLNIQQLKRQGADLETKIEELKDINQVLREGLDIFLFGLISGASMNPARSLAPAIVSGYYIVCGFILLLPLLELQY